MPSNIRQWQAAVKRVENDAQAAIREATPAMARQARDAIRSRIPPGASGGLFPGYAATGRMKSQVVAGPVRPRGKTSFGAKVGLAANATALDRIKARVHEYGKIIRARRKPYLVFKIGEQWIRAKSVRIKPKEPFRTGWEEAQRNMPALMQKHIAARWPSRRRY